LRQNATTATNNAIGPPCSFEHMPRVEPPLLYNRFQ
jgi:hypothetical protein